MWDSNPRTIKDWGLSPAALTTCITSHFTYHILILMRCPYMTFLKVNLHLILYLPHSNTHEMSLYDFFKSQFTRCGIRTHEPLRTGS